MHVLAMTDVLAMVAVVAEAVPASIAIVGTTVGGWRSTATPHIYQRHPCSKDQSAFLCAV